MKTLFTALPLHGHLLPLLPLAHAASATGDEVIVATHADLQSLSGALTYVPTGPSLADVAAENGRRHAGMAASDLADVQAIVDMFVDTRIDMTLTTLQRVAGEYRPDLVVSDNVDFVAPLVAAGLGIPWVPVSITTALPAALAGGFEAGLRRRLDAANLPDPLRLATVDVWPSWLQPPWYTKPADGIAMRPQAYRDSTATAFEPRFGPGRGQQPTVLLTFGTVINDASLLTAVLDGILRHDVNVILQLPSGLDPADIDAPADRVHVTGFVPMNQLLAKASIVVAAGGAGTVLATLSLGVPLVLIPVEADKPLIAEQIGRFGAASVATDVNDVADRVAAVISNESYRTAARTAEQRIRAMPDPAEVWRELTARYATRR